MVISSSMATVRETRLHAVDVAPAIAVADSVVFMVSSCSDRLRGRMLANSPQTMDMLNKGT
jgi:hypothetical protein